jgi:ATP-dependent Clp protease ATP-binding subunit ClpC
MGLTKLPVLLWEDLSQQTTAVLIQAEQQVAVAASAKEALHDLKNGLSWQQQQNPWDLPTEIRDPTLLMVQVKLLPRYEIGGRSFYDSSPISLPVPCVHGRMYGYSVAFLPLFAKLFYFHDVETLPQLVMHHIQDFFQQESGQNPHDYLAASGFRLDFIRISGSVDLPSAEAEGALRYLPTVATPLHKRGAGIGRALEREVEIGELMRLLEQGGAIALIGPSGVGKSLLLTEVIRRLGQKQKPLPQFWSTRAPYLIAGMRYLGQWEERLQQVLQELSRVQGTLCVEGLVDLISLGGSSPQSGIGAYLLNELQQGDLQLIIECTPEEWEACRRLLPGLTQKLRPYLLKPLEKPQAIAVLEQILKDSARQSQIRTEHHLATSIYHLFRRWLPYQSLPGQAGDFIRKLCEQSQTQAQRYLDFADVLSAFAAFLQVDQALLNDAVLWSPAEILADFEAQIKGQPQACQSLTQTVLMVKTGLNDPGKPLGVLLFCGPTGVGKTALVKVLAEKLFGSGSKERLIRLDMSEYNSAGAAEQLLTQPNGEPAEWLLQARQYPFAVILLDEIEKAAPEVFDLFLSLFDEGRLTDRFGRTTYFCNSVIVLTSNLGAVRGPAIGFHATDRVDYDKAVRAYFRPEFYNRLDAVVSFNPLGPEAIHEIAEQALLQLGQRQGLLQRQLHLSWEPAVVDYLAQQGFHKDYGARPLHRVLEQAVAVPLAHFLLTEPLRQAQGLRLKLLNNQIAVEADSGVGTIAGEP